MSTDDIYGYGIGVLPVKSPFDDVTGLPERSTTFTVKAHKPAEWYHMARLKVTGPVTGDTSQCRFWYRQASVKYRQDLRCVNQLRLAKKQSNQARPQNMWFWGRLDVTDRGDGLRAPTELLLPPTRPGCSVRQAQVAAAALGTVGQLPRLFMGA
ncbi:hypothetical protein SMIR_36875 [Streptomyces mirabilis]|uniref:hypothetical protein n=1 Tax=Streptomyces mirabilis TaxID=68239 RepID=UPI001BAF3DD7|nr:hypothetical protein [Streptomyces mirabilis]QUW84037.1 hypothetical protein SMIR_36875 [Streptomyces mirabilis]